MILETLGIEEFSFKKETNYFSLTSNFITSPYFDTKMIPLLSLLTAPVIRWFWDTFYLYNNYPSGISKINMWPHLVKITAKDISDKIPKNIGKSY